MTFAKVLILIVLCSLLGYTCFKFVKAVKEYIKAKKHKQEERNQVNDVSNIETESNKKEV